ncbi:Uncharacterised protein [Mycobacterium tuberculosis]|nr:Uncharacterised protein [Mycobacterium tuberculosis]
MFIPPRMTMSLVRPVTRTYPSSVILPRSPDLEKPSSVKRAAVSSGLARYSIMCAGPRYAMSPSSPTGNSFPPLSTILTSEPGTALPSERRARDTSSVTEHVVVTRFSLRPYRLSTLTLGSVTLARSTTAAGIGAPAHVHSRKVDRSWRRGSYSDNRVCRNVGAVTAAVQPKR